MKDKTKHTKDTEDTEELNEEEQVDFEKQNLDPDPGGLKEAEKEAEELDIDNFDKVETDDYYSDDVEAAVTADENLDPDKLKVEKEIPVTSGEMEIGDLDAVPDSSAEDALYGSDDEENNPDIDVD